MYFGLWSLVFLGALVVELATATSLVSIWFCVGALFALGALALNLAFIWQVVIFFAASLICLAAIRPMASQYLRGNIVATNDDRVIGRHVQLLKDITGEAWGELKVNGVVWNAISVDGHPIVEGSLVEIVAIEGAKLLVKKIED